MDSHRKVEQIAGRSRAENRAAVKIRNARDCSNAGYTRLEQRSRFEYKEYSNFGLCQAIERTYPPQEGLCCMNFKTAPRHTSCWALIACRTTTSCGRKVNQQGPRSCFDISWPPTLDTFKMVGRGALRVLEVLAVIVFFIPFSIVTFLIPKGVWKPLIRLGALLVVYRYVFPKRHLWPDAKVAWHFFIGLAINAYGWRNVAWKWLNDSSHIALLGALGTAIGFMYKSAKDRAKERGRLKTGSTNTRRMSLCSSRCPTATERCVPSSTSVPGLRTP